ncbi:MAG: OmpA family protein [Chitinophagaceae bacterium]|nr:MAG: OmpA family protein [Chitinophagaceae bacterium]
MVTIRNLGIGMIALAIMTSSCKSMNRTQKGAAVGTAGGAGIGAVIGKAAGNTALGAIIGATVGGVTGAVIGKKMDKQAEEIKNEVPGAKVERVDEGIVVEFSSAVLFGFDQSNLQTAATGTLNDLITVLNKYPDTNLEIQGHTDNTGSDAYNQTLSEKRASAVAGYLTSHGIKSSRIKTVGMSKNYPKYTNETPEGRSQNRRVEFLITANDKMKSDAEKESKQ